jgi:hypothetical protein
MTDHTSSLRAALAVAMMCSLLSGCKTTEEGADAKKKNGTDEPAGSGMELSMLLSMSYSEAAALSPKKLELPPFYKIAADEIEVTKSDKEGRPLKARAKGKVFIQMDYREPATALCQEALIGDDEVILRGKPVLQRGGSVVEGLNDFTVFYMLGTRLRVIGMHKLTNEGEIAELEKSSYNGGGGSIRLPSFRDSWEQGPNPLLPPLTPGAVPDSIRQELQKAAEAEMLLQQTREAAGPPQMREGTIPPPPVRPLSAEEKNQEEKTAEKKDPLPAKKNDKKSEDAVEKEKKAE